MNMRQPAADGSRASRFRRLPETPCIESAPDSCYRRRGSLDRCARAQPPDQGKPCIARAERQPTSGPGMLSPWNPSRATPTIVNWSPLIRISRPRMLASGPELLPERIADDRHVHPGAGPLLFGGERRVRRAGGAPKTWK